MSDKDKQQGNGTGDAQEEQAVDQAWDKARKEKKEKDK